MLSLLTLITTLSNPVLPQPSASERRLLHTAVNSALVSAELQRFHLLCHETEPDSAISTTFTQLPVDQSKLDSLLLAKLHTDNLQNLKQVNTTIAAKIKADFQPLTDCENVSVFQAMLDSYELSLFSLEIATPLSQPLQSEATRLQKQEDALQEQAAELISRSHSIALASISERKLLNPVEQANYLHLNYESEFMFRIGQGWLNVISPYIGMHIYITKEQLAETSSEWLLFLDQHKHIIKAIPAKQAKPYLKKLNKPEWQFDLKGNLHRN